MSRLILLPVLAPFFFAACAGPQCSGEAPAGSAAAVALDVELDLVLTLREEPLAVDLAFTFPGDDDGETFVELSSEWGGIGPDREDLVDVAVEDAAGTALALAEEGPHRWRVEHAPGSALTVRATLPRNAVGFRESTQGRMHYRPILETDLLHAIGHLFLPVPDHLEWDAVRETRLTYAGFEEAGWSVVDSLGVGAGPRRVRTSLGELRHSLFLAGDIALEEREAAGGPLVVALVGDGWEFESPELAELVTRIVALEREMMGDLDAGHYLVTAIAVGSPQDQGISFGGTGLNNAFALFLQPNLSLELDSYAGLQVRRLLAHECFHEWNGVRIRLDESEAESYWFSEGFTDHMARRVLREAGWLDDAAYAESFNEAVEAYFTNPTRNLSAEELGALFWSDRDAQDQPYKRGDVVAAILDAALREASDGEQDLLDLLRELLAEADATGRRFGTEDLLAEFAERVAPEVVEAIRGIVVDGETAALPSGVLGEGFEVVEREVYAWDPGFDIDASIAAGAAVGVRDDSPASRAGLAEGTQLVGFSVYYGEPDYEIELKLGDEDGGGSLKFFPRGAAQVIPAVAPRG